MPEYTSVCLNKQCSEHARFLNMPDISHSLIPLYKVLGTYWDKNVQNLVRELRQNVVEEQLYPLTNLVKHSILGIWQESDYASGLKFAEGLNMENFWTWQGSQYAKHYRALWICQKTHWQSSEYIPGSRYARILNMTGFWMCKSYTRFQICHNMAAYIWIGREYARICLNFW